MSRVMAHFLGDVGKKVYVLVATSGDTGSAVAQGFYKIPGIDVVILYPSGKVSKVQEMQFCTLGENITALEVDGTFDDCQRLVKTAFADPQLRQHLYLTSANSINIARLLPAIVLLLLCVCPAAPQNREPVVFSVPSGNYGNLTAGLFAWQMGLPVHRFIAASNANDTVPLYLNGNPYLPKPSVATVSNAMDVGDPSNFARMRSMYNDSLQKMQENISGYSLTDAQTREAMQEVYKQYNYIIDPHGAVAYKAFNNFQQQEKQHVQGIILGTAHPAKFGEEVTETLRIEPPMPPQLASCLSLQKKSLPMEANFEALKAYLLAQA
jgi:threonine synthase